MSTPLDNIKGLGPKKKSLLLESFGSFDNIRNASIDQIESVIKNRGLSEKIYNELLGMEEDYR
jgi:excinuclease ABC subunit C